MKIKLIVSHAFFLGKPMRDAAFICFASHTHNELATKKPQASHTKPHE